MSESDRKDDEHPPKPEVPKITVYGGSKKGYYEGIEKINYEVGLFRSPDPSPSLEISSDITPDELKSLLGALIDLHDLTGSGIPQIEVIPAGSVQTQASTTALTNMINKMPGGLYKSIKKTILPKRGEVQQ